MAKRSSKQTRKEEENEDTSTVRVKVEIKEENDDDGDHKGKVFAIKKEEYDSDCDCDGCHRVRATTCTEEDCGCPECKPNEPITTANARENTNKKSKLRNNKKCIKTEATTDHVCWKVKKEELTDDENSNATTTSSGQVIPKQENDEESSEVEVRCPTPDYLPPFFSDNEDDDSNADDRKADDRVEDNRLNNEDGENSDTEVDDQAEEQDNAQSDDDEQPRRSSRASDKTKKTYIYSNESSQSESSSYEVDENDQNDDETSSDSSSEPSNSSRSSQAVQRQRPSVSVQRRRTTSDGNVQSRPGSTARPINIQRPAKIIVLKLKCSKCSKIYDDQSSLNTHTFRVHKLKQYPCLLSDCSVSYDSWNELETHYESSIHGEVNDFPCTKCTERFESSRDLQKHDWRCHEAGHFKCGFRGCHFESRSTRAKVILHYDTHQNHQCPECPASFKFGTLLRAHMRCHSSVKPHKCTQCDMSFKVKGILTKHIQAVHEGIKPYKCTWPKCSYDSANSANVIRHVTMHHGDPPDPKRYLGKTGQGFANSVAKDAQLKNPAAAAKYRRRVESNRATKDVDEEVKEMSKPEGPKIVTLRMNCLVEGCDEHRKDREQLMEHLAEKHGIKAHRCLVRGCKASFEQIDQLVRHRTNTHKPPYPCAKCPYKGRDMISHCWLYHEEGHYRCGHPAGCDFVSQLNRKKVVEHQWSHVPRKFPCTVEGCTIACKTSTNLRKHLEAHERQKNLDCPECGKHFTGVGYLALHLKSHKRGKESTKCVECDRTFYDAGTLRRHRLAVHKDDQQYRCKWPNCGHASSSSGKVLKHIRTRHLADRKYKANEVQEDAFDFLERSADAEQQKEDEASEEDTSKKPHKRKKNNKAGSSSQTPRKKRAC